MNLPRIDKKIFNITYSQTGDTFKFSEVCVKHASLFTKAVQGSVEDFINLITELNLDDVDKAELKDFFLSLPVKERKKGGFLHRVQEQVFSDFFQEDKKKVKKGGEGLK